MNYTYKFLTEKCNYQVGFGDCISFFLYDQVDVVCETKTMRADREKPHQISITRLFFS